MQTIITRLAGIDKTTAKELVTVVGVLGFFALIVIAALFAVFAPATDGALWALGYATALAIVVGIVGKEYFA